MVNALPLKSSPLYAVDLKVGGAPSNAEESYTFARIVAWGHTRAHWLHWIQILASHTGISMPMFRFSHFAVATGHVPSTGKALTGSRSPLPAIITAVTFCTKSGAPGETSGGRNRVALTVAGTEISCKCARVPSTASKFRRTTSAPRFP